MANLSTTNLHTPDSSLLRNEGTGGSVRPMTAALQQATGKEKAGSRVIQRNRSLLLTVPPLLLLGGLSTLALSAQQDARLLNPQPVQLSDASSSPEATAGLPAAPGSELAPDSSAAPNAMQDAMQAPAPPGSLPPGMPQPGLAPQGMAPQGMGQPGRPSAGVGSPGRRNRRDRMARRFPDGKTPTIAALPPAPGIPAGRPSVQPPGSPFAPPAIGPGPMRRPGIRQNGGMPNGRRPDGMMPQRRPRTSENPAGAAFMRGVGALQAKRYAEAIGAFKNVLQIDPKALPAHINLAILYLQTRQPAQAVPHLREAMRLDPRNAAIAGQLAETLLALRRPREALEPLKKVVSLAPDNKRARAVLAQVLTEQGQYQDAYGNWEQLARAGGDQGLAAFAAGAIALEKLKRPQEAERWLRQAWQSNGWKKDSAKKRPGNPRVPLVLAQVLLSNGKKAEAEKILTTGAVHFPDAIQLHTMLADVRWSRGDKNGAIKTLRAVSTRVSASRNMRNKGPALGQLRIALGRAYAMQKQWPDAVRELKEAVQLLPREAEPRALFGEALLRAGRKEEAAAQLGRAVELDGRRQQSRRLLAQVLFETGKLDAANREYSAYLLAKPLDIGALVGLASVQEKQSRIADAAATWGRARTVAPKNPLPAMKRAQLLRKLYRDKEALALYYAAMKLAPKDPNALIGAAELEEKTGQKERALEHWKQLLALKPDHTSAYPALLRVASAEGQLNATAGFLKQQLSKSPDQRDAYVAVLQSYRNAGQEDAGRAIVKEVANLHPKIEAPRLALAAFDKKDAPATTDKALTTQPVEPVATPSSQTPSTEGVVPEVEPVITDSAETGDAVSGFKDLAEQAGADSLAAAFAVEGEALDGENEAGLIDPNGELNASTGLEGEIATPLSLSADSVELVPSAEDETIGSLQPTPSYVPPRQALTSAVTRPELRLNR